MSKQRLVVIGNGMAGVACVEHILKIHRGFDITIFGDETHVNYNRIQLSLVLAGEKSADGAGAVSVARAGHGTGVGNPGAGAGAFTEYLRSVPVCGVQRRELGLEDIRLG